MSAGVYKWSAIARVGNACITFTSNLVLARLLDPSDFGLLAMVAIFGAIAFNISSCGMSDGLIHKANPTKTDYSTVFVFNSLMGLFFCLLFIGCAHPLAIFFGKPQIDPIMWSIGICFFFSTLCFVQETRLRKELKFKTLALVVLSSSLTANVLGIVLALLGYGYWGLVSAQIFLSFFNFLFYLIYTRWLPGFKFSRKSFREMFGYGAPLMMAYIGTQIGRNLNTSVLGKALSSTASGLYFQASKLQEVPFALTESIFNWPFFSVLANEHDTAKRRLLAKSMHIRLLALNTLIVCCLMAMSWPLFHFLYGLKWDASVPIFRILLVFGLAAGMKAFYQTILKVAGRTRLIGSLTIAEVTLQIGLLIVFYRYGIMAIAATQVGAALFVAAIYLVIYKQTFGFSNANIAVQILRPMLVPAIAMAATIALKQIWVHNFAAVFDALFTGLAFAATTIIAGEVLRTPSYLELRNILLSRIRCK